MKFYRKIPAAAVASPGPGKEGRRDESRLVEEWTHLSVPLLSSELPVKLLFWYLGKCGSTVLWLLWLPAAVATHTFHMTHRRRRRMIPFIPTSPWNTRADLLLLWLSCSLSSSPWSSSSCPSSSSFSSSPSSPSPPPPLFQVAVSHHCRLDQSCFCCFPSF